MTAKQVQALVAAGESLTVEFKSEARTALNDRDLVEAVVCLANRTGGDEAWLLIGVEDDGTVCAMAGPRRPTSAVMPLGSSSVSRAARPISTSSA